MELKPTQVFQRKEDYCFKTGKIKELGVVVHTCNPKIPESEAGG
jgi:hypothetical protein